MKNVWSKEFRSGDAQIAECGENIHNWATHIAGHGEYTAEYEGKLLSGGETHYIHGRMWRKHSQLGYTHCRSWRIHCRIWRKTSERGETQYIHGRMWRKKCRIGGHKMWRPRSTTLCRENTPPPPKKKGKKKGENVEEKGRKGNKKEKMGSKRVK